MLASRDGVIQAATSLQSSTRLLQPNISSTKLLALTVASVEALTIEDCKGQRRRIIGHVEAIL